jgi:hypothetical protein
LENQYEDASKSTDAWRIIIKGFNRIVEKREEVHMNYIEIDVVINSIFDED